MNQGRETTQGFHRQEADNTVVILPTGMENLGRVEEGSVLLLLHGYLDNRGTIIGAEISSGHPVMQQRRESVQGEEAGMAGPRRSEGPPGRSQGSDPESELHVSAANCTLVVSFCNLVSAATAMTPRSPPQ